MDYYRLFQIGGMQNFNVNNNNLNNINNNINNNRYNFVGGAYSPAVENIENFVDSSSQCSPNYANGTISCFDKKGLLDIVRAYNAKHSGNQIRVSRNNSKQDIWEAIQAKMRSKCGKDETCWIEQGFLRGMQPDLEKYFKPVRPEGKYQWLSTEDIHNVMSQYDQTDKSFKFVGPLPIDFLTLGDNSSRYLQSLNLNDERKKGIKNIGIIFNMDPSTKGGSHWVSMNIDLGKREIHYFDSYGAKNVLENNFWLPYYDSHGNYNKTTKIPMPIEIQKFVFRLMKNISPKDIFNSGGGRNNIGKQIKMPFTLKINSIQHQFANSECGVYSMLFILKSRNNSFEQITKDIITDEAANKARNDLFRD
tara:strand:+ start:1749 stop:2837 length:1089 start_codon:yes stop_codon:yes gene_type:complete